VLGGYRNIFIHLPTNVVFTSAHVDFDETLFPRCLNKSRWTQEDKAENLKNSPTIPIGLDNDEIFYHQLFKPLPARKNNNNNNTTGDDQWAHLPVHS